MGQIVTFYSYKGGTGRTMAMANVGWILASAGHRVLMVDWDLEAPGLHRYLHPFLHDKELVSTAGVMDIVMDFAVQATTPASTDAERDPDWYLPLADVLRHAISINWQFGKGQLDILPAGQQSPAYAARVNSFNWDNFYERLGGGTFLEALRESMRREYDYVLIDSRTGVSDTSGICTVQMPDQIVVCFTLNRQSIEGAAAVTRSVVDARVKAGRTRTRVFPVPTRVEKAEKERLDAARAAARQRFDEFLPHVPEAQRGAYWDEIELAYQPYYAYEEVLATFGGSAPEFGTLLHSMQQLATRLTGAPTLSWTMPPADKRIEVLQEYGWGTPKVPEKPDIIAVAPPVPEPVGHQAKRDSAHQAAPHHGNSVYISYARANADDSLDRFVADLAKEMEASLGREASLFYDRNDISVGEDWNHVLVEALETSRVGILLMSPHYLNSRYTGQEVSVMRQLDMPMLLIPWIPVHDELPPVLADLEVAGSTSGGRLRSSGVRAISRVARFDDEYREFVSALAEQIQGMLNASVRHGSKIHDWESAPNAFAPSGAEERPAGSQVCFAYLAPTDAEAKQLGLSIEPYGPRPEDWRPYGQVSIRVLAATAAAQEKSTSETIDAGPSLIESLRGAEEDGRLSFLLIDPSVLRSDRHRRLLSKVDELSLARFRPVLVWPTQDSRESVIDQAPIGSLFPRLLQTRGLLHAYNEAELQATIRQHLVVMRAEAIRTAAVTPRASAPSLRIRM